MEENTRKFRQYLEEAANLKQKAMRKWIIDNIENSNKPSDQIRKEFIAKFGASNLSFYMAVERDLVD